MSPVEVQVTMRDGIRIGIALYMPKNVARAPVLLAASPYRYDNNVLPASPQFLWRETGPIEFYVERGYVFAHMDVRGSGKSEGEYEFLGRREQQDLYEVVEWLGRQTWSSGKVGGIGQSYYCMLQWFMGILNPPSLACLGAHDGLNDPYRASVYQGGIPGQFFYGYWWTQNRIINRFPANGAPGREQTTDLGLDAERHPTYDDYWRERCAAEQLDRITVPLYTIAVQSKIQLHTRGNIEGFRRARGPKKLRFSTAPNAFAAAREFSGVPYHEEVLLPFYDHYLKGLDTEYTRRPPVQYVVRGSEGLRDADTWPPEGMREMPWYLGGGPSGSMSSLNDGALSPQPPQGASETRYSYPDPGWVSGVVGFGPAGPAGGFDPARRVLTFSSPPLEDELEMIGFPRLVLHASSTAADTDFFVRISEQYPQPAEERAKGLNPPSQLVSMGWLRASHRALDPARSSEAEPFYSHAHPEPLAPGQVYRFDIRIEPQAYRFKRGSRIRLEIVNGDSTVTDILWSHYYAPNKVGTDTLHHSARYPSALVLPVR